MNTNVNFSIGEFTFNYRVVGVTLHDDKILLHQANGSNIWSLPGGRCAINEDSQTAVEREYLEEMNETIKVIRPIYFFEYFFEAKSRNQKIHELSVVYLAEFSVNSKALESEEFLGVEEGKNIRFKWFKLSELPTMEFYPKLLGEKLQNIPSHLERIVDMGK